MEDRLKTLAGMYNLLGCGDCYDLRPSPKIFYKYLPNSVSPDGTRRIVDLLFAIIDADLSRSPDCKPRFTKTI